MELCSPFTKDRSIVLAAMGLGSTIKDWFRTKKDDSVSFLAEKILRNKLEAYGCVIDFKLDSKRCTAVLRIVLKGESEAVTLDIQQYELGQAADGPYFVLKRIETSREWLTLVLREFVVGRTFPIPAQYATYTKLLL